MQRRLKVTNPISVAKKKRAVVSLRCEADGECVALLVIRAQYINIARLGAVRGQFKKLYGVHKNMVVSPLLDDLHDDLRLLLPRGSVPVQACHSGRSRC